MSRVIINHKGGVGEIGDVQVRHINHNVVGGSIGHVLNHNLADCSREEELAKHLGLYNYIARSLCLTSKGDVVFLSETLKPHWEWVCKHYDRIGLDYTKNVVWDDSLSATKKEFPDPKALSVFFFGEQAHALFPNPERFRMSRAMNQKNKFIQLCQELGIPVPRTTIFDSKEKVQDCKDFPYPVYLKISESVSGLGVVLCRNWEELERELRNMRSGLPFQVQEAIRPDVIVCLRYLVDENGNSKRWEATQSIISDGTVYEGSSYPTVHAPWHLTHELARRIGGVGETLSFDLVGRLTKQGEWEYYTLECNPRAGGAYYPGITGKKLRAPYWLSKNFSTSVDDFNHLDLGELEFDQATGRGVAVVNWGTIQEKKLGCVCLGNNPAEVTLLSRELEEFLMK